MGYSDFTDEQLNRTYNLFRTGVEYFQSSQNPDDIETLQKLAECLVQMEAERERRRCLARMFISMDRLDEAIRRRKYAF